MRALAGLPALLRLPARASSAGWWGDSVSAWS